MKKVCYVFALLSNAMLLGMALLVYLDGRNPYMNFLNSQTSKIYILIMCVLGLVTGCLMLARLRGRD